MTDVTGHIAVSDCERIRPGLIAQPVNTVSSLAYCAAGAWVLRRPRSLRRVALGISAIAAGVGSVAYHGPGGRAGKLVHDSSAAALAGTIAIAFATGPASLRRRLVTLGCLGAGAAVHASSRSDRVLCRPDSILQGHALWHALGAAAVLTVADTTESVSGDDGTRTHDPLLAKQVL